jgi:nucleoprotein TPR
LNKDKSELSTTVSELRTQLQKVTAERDSLKAQSGTVAESQDSRGLTEQLEVLKNEKAALETALAVAKSQTSSEKPDQTALIVGPNLIL